MVSWAAVLCTVAVVLGRVRHAVCVSTNDLFPYGTEHGDSRILDDAAKEATSVGVSLTDDFTFLGETLSELQVSYMHGEREREHSLANDVSAPFELKACA